MSTDMEKFEELTAKSIDLQAKTFLEAFVLEFSGSFEEVLDLAQEFKQFAKTPQTPDLDEAEAHLFLEKRGEATTVVALREKLVCLDLDKNHRLAFVEYLLAKYEHTIEELFKVAEGVDPAALAILQKAIEAYQEVLAKKEKRVNRMKMLEELAAKGGVRGMAAKNELEQMKSEDLLAANREEVTTASRRRQAQKAVDEPEAARRQALKEEEKRLAAAKKAKDDEEKAKREESRRRLAEKSKLWN